LETTSSILEQLVRLLQELNDLHVRALPLSVLASVLLFVRVLNILIVFSLQFPFLDDEFDLLVIVLIGDGSLILHFGSIIRSYDE
jgi:hypothetical protein